jgi:uncharacterized alpha-E superfamily protein
MLSRTASNLYWIGRYMERAEFNARLTEATIRLGSLQGDVESTAAWKSALSVVGTDEIDGGTDSRLTAFNARRFLTLSRENGSSVRSCIEGARENARAARNAITSEAWEAINRAWYNLKDRSSPGGTQTTLNLVEELKADTLGFEGAVARMLRREGYWFLRLGAILERGDNTARLLDVKYYLLLPKGAEVGGTLDRDQWTTILHTVAARNAYRALYRDTLRPWLIADMLVFRRELPRSLAACAHETVTLLSELGELTGRQGEADRLARHRLDRLEEDTITDWFGRGLHESLRGFIADNAALNGAIANQFRLP